MMVGGWVHGMERKDRIRGANSPQSKRKKIREMRRKVVACVCYHGSSALVFTA